MKYALLILLLPFTNAPIGYRQLTWADFKGKPINDHSASTCTGIVIEKDTAYAVFEPDKSWTRTTNPAILRHEQMHFTITEHFARLISSYKTNGAFIRYYLNAWDSMEERYDLETDHGNNLDAQKQWEEKIKL